jgi:outer membrane protein
VERHQFILNKLLLKQAAGTVDMHDLEDVNRLLQ